MNSPPRKEKRSSNESKINLLSWRELSFGERDAVQADSDLVDQAILQVLAFQLFALAARSLA
jgi:hypothetical protein